MINLGRRIKKARKAKRLTQEELANNYISRSLLSLIENGVTAPSMATLEYIASRLEKPISYFLSDESEVNESYEKLIINSEYLMGIREYAQAADKIQDFISYCINNDNLSLLSNKQLGMLYAIIGICYSLTNDNRAFEHLSKAVEKLCDCSTNNYLIKSYNYLGTIMYNEKKYIEAENYFKTADAAIKNINLDNIQLKLDIIYNLSSIYTKQKKYDLVIDLISSILPYCQKFELFYSYGKFNVLLAHSYRSTNKFNEAIDAFSNANQYYKLVKNEYMLNLNYTNMSGAYRLLNDSYNAIYYINEAIKYFEKIKDTTKLNNARVEKIITMFYFNADLDLIIDTINVMINSKVINDVSKGELLSVLASIELKNNNYQKALSLYKQAEPLLRNSIDSDMYIFIYHGISKVYEHLSDSENLLLFKLKIQEAVTIKPCYHIYLDALEDKHQSA